LIIYLLTNQCHEFVESWEAAAWSRNHTSLPFCGCTWAAGNAGSSVRSITRCYTHKNIHSAYSNTVNQWWI